VSIALFEKVQRKIQDFHSGLLEIITPIISLEYKNLIKKLPEICEKDFDNEKIWGTSRVTKVIRKVYSYYFLGVLKSNKEKLPGICEKDFDNEKIWGTTARTSY
jgi:hypothetical protein